MTESTFDITTGLSEPFFGGSGARPDEWSMPVGIDGRGYVLDLSADLFQRRSVDLLNTQDARTGKQTASLPPEVWRRVTESWHEGAGQPRFDREDTLPYRFHQSIGIDPWEKWGFSLLPDADLLMTLEVGDNPLLASVGRSLVVANGVAAHYYADVIAAPETSVTETFATAVVGMTADGENVYVLLSSGTIMRCAAGVWTTWGTVAGLNASKSMIAFVKGFILVGNGPALWDYTNGGAPTLIYTHRLTGWWWRAASEGLSVIYVLGGMGDRWHVHSVKIKSTGAALDPPIVAASLPEGEVGYSLGTYLGYVLIGVNSGWRFGMPDASGAVTYGQLIRTPGPVRCFEGQGRFVWFGLSLPSGVEPTDDVLYTDFAGLGRADLSTFVAPMTPAHATDMRCQATGQCRAVVSVGNETDGDGWRVFAVTCSEIGGSIRIQSNNLVTTGWMRHGMLSFNSNDQKMGLYGQVYHESLAGSLAVEVQRDGGGDGFIEIGTNDNQGSVTVGDMAFPLPFDSITMKITLNRDADDPTQGPRVNRTEFRAMNIPGRSTEWQIPILLHDDLTYANIERSLDVREEFDFLMGLIQSRRAFTYREGDRAWRLHATDFVWRPYKMNSESSTFQGTFVLVAREYL